MKFSVKSLFELSEYYGLSKTRTQAKEAHDLVTRYVQKANEIGMSAFQRDELIESAARVVDKFLDNYGVEYLETESKKVGYVYSNSGETYAETVFFPVSNRDGEYKHRIKNPIITSIGDIVENEYR